jgi:hypothetical protein
VARECEWMVRDTRGKKDQLPLTFGTSEARTKRFYRSVTIVSTYDM